MRAHLAYLRYVLRHKWFVLVAGVRVGAPLWRLIIHDWSKFTPAEWGAYVRNFYGLREAEWKKRASDRLMPSVGYVREFAVRCAEQDWIMEAAARKRAFERAWLHHQHANAHHWQHWILREDSGAVKVLRMPERFAREMVADWMGAGRAITGRWEAAAWYRKNADRMDLHPDTRALVEVLLGVASLEDVQRNINRLYSDTLDRLEAEMDAIGPRFVDPAEVRG